MVYQIFYIYTICNKNIHPFTTVICNCYYKENDSKKALNYFNYKSFKCKAV